MKKHLLFTLVAGLILFIWQAISFGFAGLHKSGMQYTPLQESILNDLEKSGLTAGMYVLGQPDPAIMNDKAKCDEEMAKLEGKPWAVLNYQMNNSAAMGMNMVRGLLICLVIAWILYWILAQQNAPSLKGRILLCLGIGLIIFFFAPYSNFIWFKNPDIWAHFLDAIVPWSIVGFVGHKMIS